MSSNHREFKRSYYSSSIKNFLLEDSLRIQAQLTNAHNPALERPQKGAWERQIEILKQTLQNIDRGHIYFEFSIPRMGKRVDNILIIDGVIFVLEFKVGDNQYQKYGLEQVVDYCLDLRNFHEGSHHQIMAPILISTKAPEVVNNYQLVDNTYKPLKANTNNLTEVIASVLAKKNGVNIDPIAWQNSRYKPTPTIIEAAQALYKGHNVDEISRNDAGAINLSKTTACINGIIDRAKANNKKSICFITGVPGAGKTLAGLHIANERMRVAEDEHAVFLSGNGPLVEVLREALARDAVAHAKEIDVKTNKKQEFQRATRFIQNIHHFRDDNLKSTLAPVEKVVVFDEAQRAWTKEQATRFMIERGAKDFNQSEPDYLISVMDRHDDWCTIICLIGGGQEINKGEAGVSEWLFALQNTYHNWEIHYSNLIVNDENYLTDADLQTWLRIVGIQHQELHLAANMRSFRAERVSELVNELLTLKPENARRILEDSLNDFPILLTRDLTHAKDWLKTKAQGTERIGIVASSGARRLRPIGIDAKNRVEAASWFLNDKDDVRSSYYLEDVATEFTIQGLEIDWVCLAWDINLYYSDGNWVFKNFSGTNWDASDNEIKNRYILNSYRVLLTRARQGMIILVPYGDINDHTRPPERYDQTFEYLKSCGIPEI